MSGQALLRKVKTLEKAFAVVEEHNPKFIVEMWQPNQDGPKEFDELIKAAELKIREGKKDIVLVPFGAGEKLKEKGLYNDGSSWRFRD